MTESIVTRNINEVKKDLPAWAVYPEAGREGHVTIYAATSQEAAEMFVAQREWAMADFAVCGGKETLRVVVVSPLGQTTRYEVSGRLEPIYEARPVE